MHAKFEDRIETMATLNRPFINYGPQLVDGNLHSTKSSLLLYTDDSDDLRLFRSIKDVFPYDTSFCDLPEVILDKTKLALQQIESQNL